MIYYLEKLVLILKRRASPRTRKQLNRKYRIAIRQTLLLALVIRIVTPYLKESILDTNNKSFK